MSAEKPTSPQPHALRRERFMAAIGPDGVAVVFATSEKRRNSDVHHLFRSASDFYYLTGFREPDAILVLTPCRADGESTLFVLPRDPLKEQWNGKRLGVERAGEVLGVDHAYSIDEVAQVLPGLLAKRDTVYVNAADDPDIQSNLETWMDAAKGSGYEAPSDVQPLDDTLHELRLFKDASEIALMQEAADISSAAHQRAMQVCEPGMSELRLESELQHEFAVRGARFTAYPSIVASGENACILHYVENNDIIQDGDLVLIDAGCEYEYYAADITRTFPANGTFSAMQKDVFDLVLESQLAAIQQAKPGNVFTAPHDKAHEVLADGLRQLGVLSQSVDEILEKELQKPFTVHRVSHFLGMDVHDVGKREVDNIGRLLEPNMVLTIEPGLYFGTPETMPSLDPKWHGIGIRIEDDVLVTEAGNHVLTDGVPKTAAAIESLMNA